MQLGPCLMYDGQPECPSIVCDTSTLRPTRPLLGKFAFTCSRQSRTQSGLSMNLSPQDYSQIPVTSKPSPYSMWCWGGSISSGEVESLGYIAGQSVLRSTLGLGEMGTPQS